MNTSPCKFETKQRINWRLKVVLLEMATKGKLKMMLKQWTYNEHQLLGV
jgi:hypothetical protein